VGDASENSGEFRVKYINARTDQISYGNRKSHHDATEEATRLTEAGTTVLEVLTQESFLELVGPHFVRYLFKGEQKDSAVYDSYEKASEVSREVEEEDEANTDIQILPAKWHPSRGNDPTLYQVLYLSKNPKIGRPFTEAELLTDPEIRSKATFRAERLTSAGITVVAILTQEAANERMAAAQVGHDVTAEVAETLTTDSQHQAFEQGVNSLLPEDPTADQVSAFEAELEDEGNEGTDRKSVARVDGEWQRMGQRQQALDWALRLAGLNNQGAFVPKARTADEVVADAQVFLTFLGGSPS
jgi:hypothetical protein